MKNYKKVFRVVFFTIICLLPVNLLKSQVIPADNFYHILIDSSHSKWGDYAEPEWLKYFGLDMADINGDGFAEIIAGRELYLNPGSDMTGVWEKITLPLNADGILFLNVDNDEYADIIAQALPEIYWFEAVDKEGRTWNAVKIGEVPATSHTNSQGFEKAQIFPGGREEFVIAGNGNIYLFELPENPEHGEWKNTLVAANTSDEGIGLADINGDGKIDIVAGRRAKGENEPTIIVWFENPGEASNHWKDTEIGFSNHAIDRIEIADFNGDGKRDIIISEERWPGREPDGNMFWYEQPAGSGDKWPRHRIVTQYSMNNLDIADLDRDGDMDLVTSEHKGPELELQIWENDGKGTFSKFMVDRGHESHLGSQLFDMDSDGDLDIVSIGWDQYENVHLWRNDAINKSYLSWKRYSTETGDLPVPNEGDQQTSCLVADLDKDGINDFVITERTKAPGVVWYKKTEEGWDRKIIDENRVNIEAGYAIHDIDGDGDIDIVFGGDYQSNELWWWENPFPDYERPWKRFLIKESGEYKHHDQIFGDFDGDGKQELVFWNQNAHTLFLAEIPEDPKNKKQWDYRAIYIYNSNSEMYPRGYKDYPRWRGINEHEGLAKADIDGDGVMDILGGGRWFKYDGEGGYTENIVDAGYTFTRPAAGDFIEGGKPEILLVAGDGIAPLYMYVWDNGTWIPRQITGLMDNGHTLDVLDFNNDGHLDIFTAEMRFGEGNPKSKIRILLGDGKGNFTNYYVATGYGVHEGRIADLDGDGDYDILAKPYTWKAPRIDIWINEGK